MTATLSPVAAEAVLTRAIDRSRLAPSIHNTQPWRWVVQAGTAQLWADRTRRLTVLDPHGREMMLSCGAALFHARAALLAAGRFPVVEELPRGADSDLVATITLSDNQNGTLDAAAATVLDTAADTRHTNRRGFRGHVPADALDVLRQAAESEHALLVPLTSLGDRTQVKVWQQKADQDQTADPAYLAELHHWVGAARSDDGIPLSITNSQDAEPHDLAARDLALDAVGVLPEEHDEHGTLLVVLATIGDEPATWIHAGQALARVWLEATVAGIALQPLSQSVENEVARMNLRAELRLQSYVPQLILRGGYAPAAGATPRRPLQDILDLRD